MLVFRLLGKHISLRAVNLAGLAIVLASLLISFNHIRRELSWDRYNADAGRIVRLTLGTVGQPVDGRIWGNMLDDAVRQLPQVEGVAKLHEIYRPELGYRGKSVIAGNKTCYVNGDFLRMFDIVMSEGNLNDALDTPGQVIVSESFAKKLAGAVDDGTAAAYGGTGYGGIMNSVLQVEGKDCRVAGIFRDIPETSHWRADVLGLMPEDMQTFCYTYLLLKEGSDVRAVEEEISDIVVSMSPEGSSENGAGLYAMLMPLTDIHLHSHNLRELEVNGNIVYIWLILGANALLLVVVMFNLWLNVSLVFSYNSALYRLLRLHGASKSVILKTESLQAFVLAVAATAIGLALAEAAFRTGLVEDGLDFPVTALVCACFMAVTVSVAVIPASGGMAATRFLNDGQASRPFRFSYKNVRWMLSGQYMVVIAVLSVAIGISKQMNEIEGIQAGGDGRDVMVMSGLTEPYMEKYPLLQERLSQSPYIKGMTTCFQIPGDAIRDHVTARRGGSDDWVQLPVMIAGNGFLEFYDIPLLAGEDFSPLPYGIRQEDGMMTDYMMSGKISERSEEYVINRSAMAALGFSSPQEAVGSPLEIRHGSLGYIDNGTVAGVTEDYNYTGVFEENIPLVMLHRNFFQFVLMVRLDEDRMEDAVKSLEAAWDEVYPESQSNFIPLGDIFRSQYRNEFNARDLVLAFTLLCFLIADLGLIVFMAFIIRRRTKEIAIRKVNGAMARDIVEMLNSNFIRYMALAFVAAVPLSWLVLHAWLQRFAYKTSLDWWIFAAAGVMVLAVSLLSVSLQSWRAACLNPVEGVRK